MTGAMLLGLLHSAAAEHAPAVVAVRYWSLTDVTRIAVETTGEFQFRADRAHDPERIYFDLIGTRNGMVRKGQHAVVVGDRLIKQIRVAETLPGTTRVVFDLEANVEYTASQLSNPDRLIVELRAAGVQMPTAPAVMSVTGGQTFSIADKPAPPLPQPSAVMPPAIQTGPISVASIYDPTRAKEKAIAALNASVTPVTRTRLDVPPAIVEKSRREAVKPPVALMQAAAPAAIAPAPTLPVTAAKPARLTKSGEQSLTRVLGLKVGRIVLDAGHGGHDEGTHGPTGYTEKDLVLDVTQRLGALIESRMGSEVIYTRTDDTFVPLETRTHIANEAKADLFLSIHANSSPVRASSGVETYYLNFTTSQSALEVAARENASSQKTVYELKDLLQKIALRDKVDESREFAARIQNTLYALSARSNSRAKDRGVKKAPFVVLIGASMPSVLVEVGFITNPRDESLMKKPEFRQKMAEAVYKGLAQYASTLSHFQVASRKAADRVN